MTNVVMNSKCQVTSGTLADPYTGKVISFKRGINTSLAVQIDHVIALNDAWASGARNWDQSRRVQYANSDEWWLACQFRPLKS